MSKPPKSPATTPRPRRRIWTVVALVAAVVIAVGGEWAIRALRDANRDRGLALVDQLRTAVIDSQADTVASALAGGAPPAWTTATRDTNLVIAIEQGDLAIVQLLLDHGHPTVASLGHHPLTSAVQRDIIAAHRQRDQAPTMAFTTVLLERGVSPDAGEHPALHLAISLGAANVAEWLLARGATADSIAQTGPIANATPLLVAVLTQPAGAERSAMIATLLAAGADPLALAPLGRSPVQAAAERNDRAAIAALLPATQTGDTNSLDALSAAALGDSEAITAALAADADAVFAARWPAVPGVANRPRTALDLAATNGHRGVVELLLAAGAQADGLPGERSLLHPIAQHGDADWLFAAATASGLSPATPDADGRTPLHIAAAAGHRDLATRLAAVVPNLDLSDQRGSTALLEAIRHRQEATALVLLGAGANPLLRDQAGDDALGIAVQVALPGVVRAVAAALPTRQASATSIAGALTTARRLQIDEAIISDLEAALARVSNASGN